MAAAFSPQRKKQILAVLLAFSGLLVWSRFFWSPLWARFHRQGSECRDLKSQLARTRHDLARMPQLEQQRQRLLLEASQTAPAVPMEQQLPALLGRVAKAAHSNQMKVLGLRPKKDSARQPESDSGFLEVPIEVVASAGYHATGRFLDLLENSEDLLRLESLEIQSSHDDLWNHQIRMVLQAYLAAGSSES